MPVAANSVALTVLGRVTTSSGEVRPVLNTFCYLFSGSTINLFIQFASKFNTDVWSVISPLLSSDYSWTAFRLWLPARFTVGGGFNNTGFNGTGGTSGSRTPITSAVRMTLHSDFRSQNFRGAKLFGPIALADTVGDELTGTALTSWQAAAAAIGSTLHGPFTRVFTPIIVSRDLTAAHTPTGEVVYAPVTSVTVNATLGQCRHRRETTQR